MTDQRSGVSSRRACWNQSIKSSVVIWFVAAALPAIAPAAVIFTNFGPSLSYDITQGNPVGNDFAGDTAAEGDSFIPTANAAFASVQLALSCVVGCPAADTFTVALTADNADAPGAAIESFLFSGTTLSALGINNAPIMATSVLKPTLTAGTRYWITVSSSLTYALAWNNNTTSSTVDQAVSSDGGASWFSPSGMTPSAFQVNSAATAPEPSTVLLLSGGLLLGFLRNRLVRSHRAAAGSNSLSRNLIA
jgi:PEP-CTERM motif